MHWFAVIALLSITKDLAARKSCVEKSQMSTPQGLKEIPVTLVLVRVGEDARLPCHYCSEKQGISGRIWRRRNLHGKETEVKLDLHDDDSKNRVFVDKDHTLIIREVKKEDGAYYFCYDVEDRSGKAKMDILLDVVYRTPLEPNVLTLPVDLKTDIQPLLKNCDKLENVKPLSNYKCYAEWGPWSKCDVCGKVGKRRRIGECRLQKFSKVTMETGGKAVEADFPIVGVGCHSFLLDTVPQAKKILNEIPNIVLLENCEVSCEGYMGTATEMTAHKRKSFLKKVKVKSLKSIEGVKHTVTAITKEEKEGSTLTLFCPGATLDMKVKWKFKNKLLNPEKLKEKSAGRISIDATDALHIKSITPSDAGEYVCTLYDVEIGLIRLKDPTTNFGILTIAMAVSFVIWNVFIMVKWKSFRMQRKLQKLRQQRERKLGSSNRESLSRLILHDDNSDSDDDD